MKPASFFDAWTAIGRTFEMHPRLPHSVSDLVRQMQYCGVAQALVSQRNQVSVDVYQANLSLSRLLPNGLAPLWTVLPGDAGDFPQPGQLAKSLIEHRIPAVQICPKTHAWNPRGKSGLQLLHFLAEGGWPVFVPLDTEYPLAEFEDLVDRVPNVKWVALHGNWKRQREIASLVLHNPQVHLTLEHYHANRGLELLIEKGAADRLLFASGAPAASLGASKAYIDWADTDPETRAAIAGENLRRILRFPLQTSVSPAPPADELIEDAAVGKPLRCEVIDFHSHVIEDGHRSGGSQVMLNGDSAGLIAQANRIGIDRLGVMTWRGIQGPEQDEGHRPVIAAVENHPDRFWGLATIHVSGKSDAQKIAELEQIRQNRPILGLKPYPTLGLPYDHPEFSVLWEYAETHGLYVGIHPHNWYKPDEFIAICTRHPNLRVVAYHAGHSYETANTVIQLCHDFPNLYAETNYSSVPGKMIEFLVEGCGPTRVLFGSDQPMRDPRQQLGWIVYSELPLSVKKAVLGENAKQLLHQLHPITGNRRVSNFSLPTSPLARNGAKL